MTGDREQHLHRISEAEIATHLERLLASEGLTKAAANRRLLSYLAQRATEGTEGPKETEIAIDVFGRNTYFHGGDDSVVRVAMRSLRQKLLEYYAGPGKHDRLVFDIPEGLLSAAGVGTGCGRASWKRRWHRASMRSRPPRHPAIRQPRQRAWRWAAGSWGRCCWPRW